MANQKNFGYLGNNFQLQLLNQIIFDKKFFGSIMEFIEPTYFGNKYYSIIVQMIKEYHSKYESIPNIATLEQLTISEISQEQARKVIIDTLENVKNAPQEGHEFVQDKALKFCKQQVMKKVLERAQKIIDKGDFENYDALEEMVREGLQVGNMEQDTADVFSDLDDVLAEDYRHPIPMGIHGLDNLLNGGLAKGEIGVILAPTGVGKTTILTKIANNAFNMGFNVLQIFFEDNQKIIQRKHFTLWTGLANSELPEHKEEVMDKVKEIKENQPNKLMLRKLPSDSLTMSHIKNYIRKIKSEGVTIDLLVVDYIDCILPDKSMAGADDWKSEGSVMRKFEAMCTELDIAGWTATQGNRSSISSDVVTTDQMGGSIKKAQVGHVIISIAKSLQQKEMNLATIAITKSRIGRDGIVFENCKFNNELLDIDTEQSVTFLGLEEKKEESLKQRQKELMDRRRQREQTI